MECPWPSHMDSTAQIHHEECGSWGPSWGTHFLPQDPQGHSPPPLPASVHPVGSMQTRADSGSPCHPEGSSPWLSMGSDWFDLVRQPLVSQYLFSGICKHRSSGLVRNSEAIWVQSMTFDDQDCHKLWDLELASAPLWAFLSLHL